MRLRFFVFFIFLTSYTFCSAETFLVLKVTGSITSNGTEIKRGSKLNTGDKIKFVTPDAIAEVVSPRRGRLILKKDAKARKSELRLALENFFDPPHGQLSTRSGGINNTLDLRKHFDKKDYLVLGESVVEMNKKTLALSDSTFLFIRFFYDGEEINKKIPHEIRENESVFILDMADLLVIDGKPAQKEKCKAFSLFYYDAIEETSVLMTEIDFALVDEKELKAECHLIRQSLAEGEQSEEEIKDDILSYITSNYGTPTASNFNDWYASLTQ